MTEQPTSFVRLPNFNDFLSGVESCGQAARINSYRPEGPRTFEHRFNPSDSLRQFTTRPSTLGGFALHSPIDERPPLRSLTAPIQQPSIADSSTRILTTLPPLLVPRPSEFHDGTQRLEAPITSTSNSPAVVATHSNDGNRPISSAGRSQHSSLGTKDDNKTGSSQNQYTFSRWGLTKDNKPRKRLAQACNACRLRKIKCVPGFPRCYDCTSRSVDCVYETKRAIGRKRRKTSGGQTDPIQSPGQQSENPSEMLSPPNSEAMDIDVDDPTQGSPASTTSITSGFADSTSATPLSMHEISRRESEPEPRRPNLLTTKISHSRSGSSQLRHSRPGPSSEPDSSHYGQGIDPYWVDTRLADQLLEGYFSPQNSTEKWVLPKAATLRWIRTDRDKCLLDRMLLYALLALGSMFTGDTRHAALRQALQGTCEGALSMVWGESSLQVIHTKIILAKLCLNHQQLRRASDLAISAMQSACAIGINVDALPVTADSSANVRERQRSTLDLSSNVFQEYRRRLYWSCSLLTYSLGPHQSLLEQNTRPLTRLPCRDIDYERDDIPLMPAFDGDITRTCYSFMADPSQRTTGMTLLCQIAQLYDSILSHAYDTQRSSPLGDRGGSESFYRYVHTQLHAWDMNSWSESKAASKDSGPRHGGRAGNVMVDSVSSGLHLLYHDCGMLLHRCTSFTPVDEKETIRNIQKAFKHARTALEIAGNLVTGTSETIYGYELVATSPFTARILLNAIDIVTCAGAISDFSKMDSPIMRLVLGGLEVLDHLAEYWYEARRGRELVKERIQALLSLSQKTKSVKQYAFAFSKPIYDAYPVHLDLVYQVPRLAYLHALGVGGLSWTHENLLQV